MMLRENAPISARRRADTDEAFIDRAMRAAPLYAMITPTFGLLAVFCLVPFLWAFSTSLYSFEVGEEPVFLGLANYRNFLHDPTFAVSFAHMAALTAFAVLVTAVVPLTIAKLIFSLDNERASYLYRVLFLAPVVVPGVAMQLIWKMLVYGDAGIANSTLGFLHLDGWIRAWLNDPHTALWAVAFVGFPFASGINVLIYYAGLTAIPDSVHEAARLDGAVGLTKFLRVDVPLVLSQLKLLVILTLIHGVQAFEGMLVLTRGGPGFKTMVPGLWMYFNAFSFQKMGYACAIGVVLFLVILGLTILNLRYFRSAEDVQQGARA